MGLAFASAVDLSIDTSDLPQPDMSLLVFHVQNVIERPVEVIRDIRYLLMKLFPRIGGDRPPIHPRPDWPAPPSPPSAPTMFPVVMSMSNSLAQAGHAMCICGAPSSLILR